MAALLQMIPYDRAAAVSYAHKWAFGRNPAYYDYENIGGDCTNFASQCLYQGTGVMNYTPTYGWYYINANRKAPAWTGVEFFYDFLVRSERTSGPIAVETGLPEIMPGDFVQLGFQAEGFDHTPIVVETGFPPTLDNTLAAAHSADADWRPLSSYEFTQIRFLHVLGAWRPD